MRTSSSRSLLPRILPTIVLAILAACGGSSSPPTQPSPPAQRPTVSAISPSTGSTLGGAAVTITGTNFAPGATVTIGGAVATNVAVPSATTITATTPQRAAGAGDVVVTVGTLSGALPGGFTFTAPTVTNSPPTITGLTAQDQRPGTPPRFADLEDLVDVAVAVQDAETPAGQLRYEWSAPAGTFEGEGARVRWRAPDRFATPGTMRLTVVVVERYDSVNDQGLPIQAEHRVTGGVDVRLHDSEKEIVDLGYLFLVDFSQQQLSPSAVVRNFTDSCRGKVDELRDVEKNQREETITAYSVGSNPPVIVSFGAVCPYFAARGRVGDGCANFPVRWNSTSKLDGKKTVTEGLDQVNAVYENGQWRLCDSDFNGRVTVNGMPSLKTFKK